MSRVMFLLAALGAACSSGSSPQPPGEPQPMPDFELQDVNPNSPTTGQDVSPRDQLGFVSAWYFGDAT